MLKIVKNIALAAAASYGVYVALNAFGVFGEERRQSFIQVTDVSSAVDTSIASVQAQNKLLVLTSRINSIATSQQSQYGMTAEQSDVASADVQYQLDLSKFNASMVLVGGDEIYITIPNSMLTPVSLPYHTHRMYDNNSWLFTVNSGVRDNLTKANVNKINADISTQAETLRSQAKTNSIQNITSLFSIPLNAANVNKKVIVKFENI